MTNITDELTRTVQIWTGVSESADNSDYREMSFRGQIDDYWLGTECPFLTLMSVDDSELRRRDERDRRQAIGSALQ